MTSTGHPSSSNAVSPMDQFHALVKSHASMVFATARRVTGDAGLAEDVAQETFLELSRQGYHAIDSVSAWLHRVAWRKACNVVRGEYRRRRHEHAAAEAFSIPDEAASWQELEPLIDNALEELPFPLKELLVEHYLQGRTQQEIASARGQSQSTISRQLDSGLHELRARLRSHGALCGTALTALLETHSAEAAPAYLQASLGKLALSGVGATATGVPVSIPVATSLVAMSLAKITLSTVVVAGLIAIPFALHHKGQDDSAPPKPAAPAPLKTVASSTRPTTATKPNASIPHYRPPPVTEAVRLKADAVIRRHKNMSREEMLHDQELQQLMSAFSARIELGSPEMQKKMEEAAEALQETKGIKHGTINMDFGTVESPEFRTWVEAALSDDTDRVQDWVLSRLQGAVFEFAMDPKAEHTSDGVRVLPAPAGKGFGEGEGKKEEKHNF